MIEICCGSYADAVAAARGGARQIELNSALALGGLTPTPSTVALIKQTLDLCILAMVRPRGGGFCYDEAEFRQMLTDGRALLEQGADGLVFGCLNPDASIHVAQTATLVELCKEYHALAVFHRAFDQTPDPHQAVQTLIDLEVDRVLISGQQATAIAGQQLLAELEAQYGTQIDILAGSGLNAVNVAKFIRDCGITRVHSSCKDWALDPTTRQKVDFSYDTAHPNHYDTVSADKVVAFITAVQDAQ